MMNHNRRLLLCLAIPLVCAMRDPFEPAIDSCQTAQLSLWHYWGVAQSAEQWIGMMQSGEGKWHRIEKGKRLITGWQVSGITHGTLTVDVGEGCEPRYWQWKREGTFHDEKDKSADVADRAAVEPSEKRHAGG